jgi:hypothetical protein
VVRLCLSLVSLPQGVQANGYQYQRHETEGSRQQFDPDGHGTQFKKGCGDGSYGDKWQEHEGSFGLVVGK